MTDKAPSIDTRKLERSLRRLSRRAPEIARRASILTAEAILAEAQFEAPVKTGFLQNSSVVDSSDKKRVEFGFNTDYAAAVHETHKTKSKFLLNAIVNDGKRIVRAAIKKAFKEKSGLKGS